jgi:hypothetical protein
MAGDFIKDAVQKANDPSPDKDAPNAGTKDARWDFLRITLRRLFRHASDDTRPEALNEMAARVRQSTKGYWEYSRRFWARAVGENLSEIRLPENMCRLEDEFWGRVAVVIHEAVEGQGPEPNVEEKQKG